MTILVDDQLALAAALGLLNESDHLTLPVATTYGFHFRLLQPLVEQSGHRPSKSPLKSLVQAADLEPAEALELLASPDSGRVLIINPVRLTAVAVQMRERFSVSLLGAEVLAATTELDLPVRLTPRNYRGPLVDALENVDSNHACWGIVGASNGLLTVNLTDSSTAYE